MNEDEFQAVLQTTIADVVRKQAEVGLDIINDGDYGKSNWANYILERISGFEHRPDEPDPLDWLGGDRERFNEFYLQELKPFFASLFKVDACIDPISYINSVPLESNIQIFKSALDNVNVEDVFMTAVAPASAVFTGVNEFYETEQDYVFALADALREEYLRIHKAGLIVQVDDAVLANMYDHLTRKSTLAYQQWAELRVAALNRALEGIPEDRVRYHICFGSWHMPHVSDAPLENILGIILQVNAGAYSFEAANPRHEHEWRVWSKTKLPEGKILIPGVITHHTITVEHPRIVADRIIRFAELVGRENVIAGTDCGFAQAYRIQRVHPQIMWAKFESLVAGARLASSELWQ